MLFLGFRELSRTPQSDLSSIFDPPKVDFGLPGRRFWHFRGAISQDYAQHPDISTSKHPNIGIGSAGLPKRYELGNKNYLSNLSKPSALPSSPSHQFTFFPMFPTPPTIVSYFSS